MDLLKLIKKIEDLKRYKIPEKEIAELLNLANTNFDNNFKDKFQSDFNLGNYSQIFNLFSENVSEMLYFKDINLKYIYCNVSFSSRFYNTDDNNFFGFTDKELISKYHLHKNKQFLNILNANDISVLETKKQDHFIEEIDLNEVSFVFEIFKTPVFDSQNNFIGIIACIKDISRFRFNEDNEKKNLKNLEFLSKSAMDFVEINQNENIYDSICEKLSRITENCFLIINSYDPDREIATVRALHGLGKNAEFIFNLLGYNPIGLEIKLGSRNQEILFSGKLELFDDGLYEISENIVPKIISNSIETFLGLKEFYIIGFLRKNVLFGSAVIITQKNTPKLNKPLIETFIKQASVAVQRKLVETELSNERNRLEKIIELNPFSMVICNENGEVIKYNNAYIELFGAPPKKNYNCFNDALFLNSGYKNELENLQKGNTFFFDELFFSPKSYNPKWTEKSLYLTGVVFPIKSETGKILNFVQIYDDITLRKNFERNLKEKEELYRTLVDQLPDMVIIHINGNIIFGNAAFENILGYSKEEYIGENFSFFIKDNFKKLAFNNFKKRIKGVAFNEYDLEIVNKRKEVLIVSVKAEKINYNNQTAVLTVLTEITQRKKAEEDLIESRKRYQDVIENIGEGIGVADYKEFFKMVNPAAESIFGVEGGKLVGRNLNEFLSPDQRMLVGSQTDTRKKGQKSIYELSIIRPDGEKRIISVTATPRFDKTGVFIGTFGIFHDITEQLKVINALTKSEEHYRELFENANDMVFTSDFEGNITSANPIAEKILGYKIDLEKGFNIRNFVSPESFQIAMEKIKQKLEKKNDFTSYEITAFTKDGEQVVFEINSFLRFKDGLPNEIFGIARNITERKIAEEALRIEEEKYRLLFEDAPLGIITVNTNGKIIEVNESLIKILASPSAEKTKEINFFEFKPLIDSGITEDFKSCIQSGINFSSERSYTTLWGKPLDLRINLKPIRNALNEITGAQGTVEDVSEQKKAQDQIKSALEEKEVLLREVHHRVKNNMQVILSLINMQKLSITDLDVLNKFRELQERVRTMSMVHEDLYISDDLSKIEFGNYLINLTNNLFRVYGSRKDIFIQFDIQENIFLSLDFSIPCGLIVNEILSNALKYAFPENFSQKSQKTISVKLSSESNEIKLEISDNGMGLPPDFNFSKSKTMGIRLINVLANDQLNGKISVLNKNGTHYEITFQTKENA
ncbi:MAG: PAS domain S-box protein [Bacteroidetes bacterium]|nr:PAS domain S-box protein [Bacteroidota bacterium]